MNDREVVAVQLGRPSRSAFEVTTRCHLGLPVVIAVPPLLDDDTPFPTRFWLTCSLAVRRVGRLESTGGVKAVERLIEQNPDLSARHEEAMERYRRERDDLVPPGYDGPQPSGGVGGARTGVKCLHAHLADLLAGNANPVGTIITPNIEPLNCSGPCVVDGGSGAQRNPAWTEPAR